MVLRHWDCAAACGADAELTCVTSLAEAQAVSEVVTNTSSSVWVGHFRRANRSVDNGWDLCSSGESAGFASYEPNWYGDEPNNAGGEEECAYIHPADKSYRQANWFDDDCLSRFHCLCEHGKAARIEQGHEYQAFVRERHERIRTWVLLLYLVIIPVAALLLPALACFCIRGARSCTERMEAREDGTALQISNTADIASTSSSSFTSATVLTVIDAERAARRLRHRVSGTIAWLGWTLCVAGLSPFVVFLFVTNVEPLTGATTFHLGAFLWGVPLVVLGLRPTDVKRIHGTCLAMLVALLSLSVLTILAAQAWLSTSNFSAAIACIALAAVFGGAIPFLAPAVCSCSRMPARRQLQRLWLVLRLLLVGMACALTAMPIGEFIINGWLGADAAGMLVSAVMALLPALALKPRHRASVHLWLGGLGPASSAQQKATTIACLLGGTHAMRAVARATARFRLLPLKETSADELAENFKDEKLPLAHGSTTSRGGAAHCGLYARTVAGESFGSCRTFVSHSHRDDAEAKARILMDWRALTEGDVAVWLDTACLAKTCGVSDDAQSDDLLLLPLFLSFCDELLILAGRSWASRLWCCVELFAFVQMGGKGEDITVWRLEASDVPLVIVTSDAKCTFEKDRQELLGVIEASFGMLTAFDAQVNAILQEQVTWRGQAQGVARSDGGSIEMASIAIGGEDRARE